MDASEKSVATVTANDLLIKPAQTVIDAGIVFTDEASYLCVPLNRLGITDSDQVVSAQSSCECIRPSIVHFYDTPSKTARALRIDFRLEPTKEDSSISPLNLAVEVALHLGGGRTILVTIRNLQTTYAQGLE